MKKGVTEVTEVKGKYANGIVVCDHEVIKPKKISKHQQVKNHLIKFGQITSWDAIKLYRATRLSAIIYNLKKEGLQIDTEMVNTKNTKFAIYKYIA